MVKNSILIACIVLLLSACSAKEFETGIHQAGEDLEKLFEVRE